MSKDGKKVVKFGELTLKKQQQQKKDSPALWKQNLKA